MLENFTLVEGADGYLRRVKNGVTDDTRQKYIKFYPIALEKIYSMIDTVLQIQDDANTLDVLNVLDSALDKSIGFVSNMYEVFDCSYITYNDPISGMLIDENKKKILMSKTELMKKPGASYDIIQSIYNCNEHRIKDAAKAGLFERNKLLTVGDIELRGPGYTNLSAELNSTFLFELIPNMIDMVSNPIEGSYSVYTKSINYDMLLGTIKDGQECIGHDEMKHRYKEHAELCNIFMKMKKKLYSYFCAVQYDPENMQYNTVDGMPNLKEFIYTYVNAMCIFCVMATGRVQSYENLLVKRRAIQSLIDNI